MSYPEFRHESDGPFEADETRYPHLRVRIEYDEEFDPFEDDLFPASAAEFERVGGANSIARRYFKSCRPETRQYDGRKFTFHFVGQVRDERGHITKMGTSRLGRYSIVDFARRHHYILGVDSNMEHRPRLALPEEVYYQTWEEYEDDGLADPGYHAGYAFLLERWDGRGWEVVDSIHGCHYTADYRQPETGIYTIEELEDLDRSTYYAYWDHLQPNVEEAALGMTMQFWTETVTEDIVRDGQVVWPKGATYNVMGMRVDPATFTPETRTVLTYLEQRPAPAADASALRRYVEDVALNGDGVRQVVGALAFNLLARALERVQWELLAAYLKQEVGK